MALSRAPRVLRPMAPMVRSLATIPTPAAAPSTSTPSTTPVAQPKENKVIPYELAQVEDHVSVPWSRYNLTTPDISLATAAHFAVASAGSLPAVGRKVTIYKQAKSSMVSRKDESRFWRLQFDRQNFWASSLMGWMGSADPFSPVQELLRFPSKEAAMVLCERNGWAYEVVEPPPRNLVRFPAYADNFLAPNIADKIKNDGPKKAKKIYANSSAGQSQWINLKRSDYGDDVWKSRW